MPPPKSGLANDWIANIMQNNRPECEIVFGWLQQSSVARVEFADAIQENCCPSPPELFRV
jgi:hypothetical protein